MTEDAPALPVETDPAADTAAERSTELLPTTPAPATGALEPLPLIPELPEPTELPRQRGTSDLPAGEAQPPKPSVTAAAIEAQKARVRFREAKTKALRDPAIVAEWENSRRARTDFEKRESLKRYFKLLYARMEKLDGTLGEQIQQQQRRSLARLEQRRIEATEPLDPVERTDRFYEVQ
jgi:type IV secretory pathway VirB10-like protein